jgi:hypothetical protein
VNAVCVLKRPQLSRQVMEATRDSPATRATSAPAGGAAPAAAARPAAGGAGVAGISTGLAALAGLSAAAVTPAAVPGDTTTRSSDAPLLAVPGGFGALHRASSSPLDAVGAKGE